MAALMNDYKQMNLKKRRADIGIIDVRQKSFQD